jgi:precorrin-4/cobalt-precorrin-4 C11-methyltransferase
VVLTRLAGRTAASMPDRESVAAFAAHRATKAVFLSAARPVELQRELLAGYAPETPAAIVVRASWPDEKVVRTTVANLCRELAATKARTTVLVLVGDALAERPAARSHLYSPEYSHKFRKARPA